jgi:hypothetical protein
VDPAPPPITITDPNAPPLATEVLTFGDERRRRRPSSRATRRAALWLAVVAVAGVGLRAGVGAVLAQRADAKAVAEVDLTLLGVVRPVGVLEGDDLLPVTTVQLVSHGAHHVQLTDVQLVGATARAMVGDLGPDPFYLPLPALASCDLALLSHPPNRLRLGMRTYRGQHLTRTLTLGAEELGSYVSNERVRCGFPPPGQAAMVDLRRSEVAGRTLVAHYVLGNDSLAPLDLVGIRGSAGLTVSTSATLPLRLVARTGARATFREVVLRIRVTDCDAYRSYIRSQEHLEPSLELVLKDRFAQEELQVGLNTENDGILPTEVYAAEQLLAWCTPPTRSG